MFPITIRISRKLHCIIDTVELYPAVSMTPRSFLDLWENLREIETVFVPCYAKTKQNVQKLKCSENNVEAKRCETNLLWTNQQILIFLISQLFSGKLATFVTPDYGRGSAKPSWHAVASKNRPTGMQLHLRISPLACSCI